MDTKPSHDQLLEALYFALDLFSRPNIPYFLLDETAYSVRHNKALVGDRITVGIRKVDAGERTMGILDAFYTPSSRTESEINYNFKDVPITVKIVDSTAPMYSSLNPVMYHYETFYLPNPFDLYWKEKIDGEEKRNSEDDMESKAKKELSRRMKLPINPL